ncbi:MAG: carbohydrate binding family 9 domain-containing protein [bacterium]|nr:carbohydrate binding family 9 domain-containing protein [bacterium]
MVGRAKVAAFVGLCCLALPAQGGDARRANAVRIVEGVRLDGRLDEDAWRDNPTIGELSQANPRPGEPPTERTLVWVGYTEDSLFIAVRCLDSAAERILATEMSRDAYLYFDDRIQIVLDTFHDRRNAYFFSTNPAGALVDGRITENRYPDMNWDGIWSVRARIDEKGWTAEFEIPFKTLAFNPGNGSWGFNISRRLARLREESRWATPSLDVRLSQVATAGAIDGLEELSQGIGLDIKPYGLVGYNRDITRGNPTRVVRDVGADIFYRITANLVSSTTVNTDFAETEVDTRQVNLTRFPLFFPEKRTFFLEDAGIFDFGIQNRASAGGRRVTPDVIPFFSRRIGLVGGEEVPILVGQKVTGKVGRFDVGVLDVLTRDSETLSGQNFFVGRTKMNFWEQSYIGGLVTSGEPTGKTTNSVAGVDMRLATSDFLKRGKNFHFAMYGSKSQTPGVTSRDMAYGGEVSYPNDLLYARYRWQEVGENYKPALGFVRRRGVRISNGVVSLNPRPEVWNVRRMNFMLYYTSHFSRIHNALESRLYFINPFEVELNDGQRFEYSIRRSFERLFKPFEIRDDIPIPVGDYNYTAHRFSYHTATNRPWFLSAGYSFGSFYTGRRKELSTTLLWRKNSHISAIFELRQHWVRLREGQFNTRLALFRLNYSFSPLVTLSNFVQYDTDSANIGLQSRLRWIVKPGNEVFLVLNHSWQENTLDRFEALRTDVRAKVNYTFRF